MADAKSFQDAVKKGDLEAVKHALAGDESLASATNDVGQSSFILAKYYRHEAIAAYLLEHLPGLNLFEACAAGQMATVEETLRANPEALESRNADGWTPLHLAAFFGHSDLVSRLLDIGAQVDARSTNAMRNTPLHAAAAAGRSDLVKLLLERGADANAGQEGGWTALHAGALSGNREMIEVLLAYGADVNARASNNQSALDLALQKGNGSIAELLEQLGAKLG